MPRKPRIALPRLNTRRVFLSVFATVMDAGYPRLHDPADMKPSELREELDACIHEALQALGIDQDAPERLAPFHDLIDDAHPLIAHALTNTTDLTDEEWEAGERADSEGCGECGDAILDGRGDGVCSDACWNARYIIPSDFPVSPLPAGHDCPTAATCGTCGLSWDDAIATSYTPAPSARCPFEAFHR